MLLGKGFNMAYSVLMLNSRPLLWLSPFGNWSEKYIQIRALTLLGKGFNMAYSVLMLNPRPLPS